MMDEGHAIDVINVDFAKGFDSRVRVGGELSRAIPMHSGVPKGSVINPRGLAPQSLCPY